MARIRRRAAVQCSAGSVGLELLTFVSRPRLNVDTAVCLYRASLVVWAVASFISGGCLVSLLSPASSSFRVSDSTQAAAIFAFLTTPVVPAKVEAHE